VRKAEPLLPKGPVAAQTVDLANFGTGTRNPVAKHLIVQIPANVNANGEQFCGGVDNDLNALAIVETAIGPDIKALLLQLEPPVQKAEVPPHQSAREKATILEAKLKQADADVHTSLSVSTQMHEMATMFRNQIFAELEVCQKNITSAAAGSEDTPPLSFAVLDQRRAAMVASHASWQAKAREKRSEVWKSVKFACDAAEDTITTLRAQQAELTAKHLAHQEAFERINNQLDKKKQFEIAKMVEKCEASRIIQSGTLLVETATPTDMNNLLALQSMVMQLQKQLATLGVQPIVLEQASLVKASTASNEATGGCDMDASDENSAAGVIEAGVDGIVLQLTDHEKAARIAQAEKSVVSTTALAKGKGKGKPDNSGVY